MPKSKIDLSTHTHSGATWWEYDARGIELCRVCDDCVEAQLARYRRDVLTDSNYWAHEPIDPE